MTADQRRRLEALFAAVAPCLGCVEQDLVDVESLFPDYSSQLRDLVDGMRQAKGLPSTRPSEEELERQRIEAQAWKDRLTRVHREVLRTVPPAKRRTSCPECVVRKRHHDQITAVVDGLMLARQLDKEDEERDEASEDPGSAS